MWTRACRDRHAVPERPVPRRPSGVVDSDGRTHGVRQLMSNTALIDRLVMASNWTLSTWKDKLDDHVWAALFPKRSEEHTSELQSLMRISYAVFCLKNKKQTTKTKEQHVMTAK